MQVEVKSLGVKKYQTRCKINGCEWTFTLQGGLFSNERKARNATESLVSQSFACLVAAEMIRTVFAAPLKKISSGYDVPYKSNIISWDNHQKALEELALAVPKSVHDFRTGSDSISQEDIGAVGQIATAIVHRLISEAPNHVEGSLKNFMEVWWRKCGAVEPRSITSDRGKILADLYGPTSRYRREHNSPGLVARSASTKAELRAFVMTKATAHLTEQLPEPVPVTGKAGKIVVRGDRAQTLLNVMLPQIEDDIGRISNPADRAKAEARIAEIRAKVEAAAAKSNAGDPAMRDVMLSLDTLEATVDARLGLDDAPQV